jgi:hypothetical protein
MDAPHKKFNRLVEALEDLVTHEAATVAEHNYGAVADIQRRTQPLVEAIAELGSVVSDAVARARVAGLLARRQHSIDYIESQLATARSELMAVQESASRVAQIGPAYGRLGSSSRQSQFRATG